MAVLSLLKAVATLLLATAPTARAASSCSCDDASDQSSRRLSRSSLRRGDGASSLKVSSFLPAKTTGMSYVRPAASAKPFSSLGPRGEVRAQVASEGDAACTADQVHISLGNDLSSMFVSYVDYSLNTSAKVTYSDVEEYVVTSSARALTATGSSRAHSELLWINYNLVDPNMGMPTEEAEDIVSRQDTKSWAFDVDTGDHWGNWYNVTSMKTGFGSYNNPYMYYDSPMIHTVEITGLEPLVTYFYRVEGSCIIHQFTMPAYSYDKPASAQDLYPFLLGLVGDLGQTQVSVGSMEALADMEPDTVLLVGDLCYADGYEYIWDSFGKALEILGTEVPIMTTGGNHEVQSGENYVPYELRYQTPHASSGSPNPSYWGREVGPVHVIAVNSYASTTNTSFQYEWLANYLSTRINRERTPWVVLMMHTPWYCSNTVHYKEGELTRLSMEALVYEHGVDVVLSGHIHAYERTLNMYDGNLDECGPNYFVLGDGGNYEGPASPWRNEGTASGAPDWSAFRESSFGVAGLNIVNETHAYFSWNRHACGSDSEETYHMNFSTSCATPDDNSANAMDTSDEVWLVRPDKTTCSNRHYSTSYKVQPYGTASVASADEDDDDNKDVLLMILAILCSVFGAALVILCFVVYYLFGQLRSNASKLLVSTDEGARTSNNI